MSHQCASCTAESQAACCCRRTLAGVYTALAAEGRALSSEESFVADAALDSGGESGEEDDLAAAGAAGEVASLEEVAANPLLALQASPSGRFLTEDNQERLLSNAGNMQLYFLSGSAAPNNIRHTTSCIVRTSKSAWLFECGEDSQRHLG